MREETRAWPASVRVWSAPSELLERLVRERDAIQDSIGRTVTWHLKEMARMGVYFEQQVQQRYPEFEIRGGIQRWDDYLPPLSPVLHELLEAHGA